MFKRHFTSVVALAVMLLGAGPAQAEWFYENGERDVPPQHIALAVNGTYAAGFRCEGRDALTVFYITPEALERSDIKTLSRHDPELLMRFDGGEIIAVPVTMELTDGGNLTVWSHAAPVSRLVRLAESAEGQMSVAIEILGERMHIQDFDVRGSTRSISAMLDGCGL